jgi:hypothetical protein
MGRARKEDWTVGFHVATIFSMSINSTEPDGKSLHFVFSLLSLSSAFTTCVLCACVKLRMVRIKHNARPRILHEPSPMASDEAAVPSQQMVGSLDASSSRSANESGDCESCSGGSGSTMSRSDEFSQTKVTAVAAAVMITYDFRLLVVGKVCITSLESRTHYLMRGVLSSARYRVSFGSSAR